MIREPATITLHAPALAPKLSAERVPEGPPIKIRSVLKLPPATWAELHTRALRREGREVRDDSRWLGVFGIRIQGRCECRKNWTDELKRLPPDYSNYFAWTVAIHNAVNRLPHLNKPELGLEEAHQIWSRHPSLISLNPTAP